MSLYRIIQVSIKNNNFLTKNNLIKFIEIILKYNFLLIIKFFFLDYNVEADFVTASTIENNFIMPQPTMTTNAPIVFTPDTTC